MVLQVAAVFSLGVALMSGLGYGLMTHDKRSAKLGQRRIRESHLLTVALLGGWPGVWLAASRVRHKTRKMPFLIPLAIVSALNFLAIAGILLAIRNP